MAVVSVNIVALYAVFGLVVHSLSKWNPPEINLNDDTIFSDASEIEDNNRILTSDGDFRNKMQALQARKRKNDDLGILLRILTDDGSAQEEKGNRKSKKQTYLPEISEDTDRLVKKNI